MTSSNTADPQVQSAARWFWWIAGLSLVKGTEPFLKRIEADALQFGATLHWGQRNNATMSGGMSGGNVRGGTWISVCFHSRWSHCPMKPVQF